MKIRAILRLKNEHLVRFREESGLSQRALAEQAGIPYQVVWAIENLSFNSSHINPESQSVLKLSLITGIDTEVLVPPELCSKAFKTKYEQVADIDSQVLLLYGQNTKSRLSLPSPAETMEQQDMVEYIKRLLTEDLGANTLTSCEREVVAMKYGLGRGEPMSTKDVAKKTNRSFSGTNMHERAAVRKIKQHLELKEK